MQPPPPQPRPLYRNHCPQIDTQSIIMGYCIIHHQQLVLTTLPQLEMLAQCCFGYDGRKCIDIRTDAFNLRPIPIP